MYMFQCFETPGMGSEIFTFLCFSLFQNVSKQLKVWTKTFSPVSVCFETIKSVDLDIFSLFQIVSEVLLYNLYASKDQI